MAEYLIQDTTLTGIADAIRGKTGGSALIMVSDMASKIGNITTPVLQEKTVTPTTSVIEVTPDTGNGYNGLSKVIVEAMASGGGGGNVLFAYGSLVGEGKQATVNHNLGCVPDVVFVLSGAPTATGAQLIAGYAVSRAFKAAHSLTFGSKFLYGTTTSPYVKANSYSSTYGIEDNLKGIGNATETTVTLGGISEPLYSGIYYTWIAIGGLI